MCGDGQYKIKLALAREWPLTPSDTPYIHLCISFWNATGL